MGKRSLLVASLALPGQAIAADAAPFATVNMNPFMTMYGGAAPRTAVVTETSRVLYETGLTLANNSISATDGTEEIVLDGESYFVPLRASYGAGERWEVGATLPLIYHSSGHLDNFIEQWHRVFGLTNSRRDAFPSNQLDYRYRADGIERYAVTSDQGGIGDLTLHTKYAALTGTDGKPQVALAAEIKLPSGEPEKLTGSGAVDVALSVHGANSSLSSRMDISVFGGFGISILGDGEIIPERQENQVYSGYLGGGWRPWSTLTVKMQLNYTSALYDSEVEQLGGDSVQLYLGGSYVTRGGTRLDLAIGENLYTDPTPDFLIHFGLSHPLTFAP